MSKFYLPTPWDPIPPGLESSSSRHLHCDWRSFFLKALGEWEAGDWLVMGNTLLFLAGWWSGEVRMVGCMEREGGEG